MVYKTIMWGRNEIIAVLMIIRPNKCYVFRVTYIALSNEGRSVENIFYSFKVFLIHWKAGSLQNYVVCPSVRLSVVLCVCLCVCRGVDKSQKFSNAASAANY